MAASAPAAPSASAARWRYAIPNAITCGNLLFGLWALTAAWSGRLDEAAWSVVACALLDKLDGTAARLLRATSNFGVQMDSFADFVAFGLAPAALTYACVLVYAPDELAGLVPGSVIVHMCCAIFVVCSALRLARFNTQTGAPSQPIGWFAGIPTTLAGGMVALLYLVASEHQIFACLAYLPVIALVFALLMVSSFPFPKVALRRSRGLNAIQGMTIVLAYVAGALRCWPEFLLALTTIYGCGGLTCGIVKFRKARS